MHPGHREGAPSDAFLKTIVRRMADNADIFQRILDDRDFQTVVMDHYQGAPRARVATISHGRGSRRRWVMVEVEE